MKTWLKKLLKPFGRFLLGDLLLDKRSRPLFFMGRFSRLCRYHHLPLVGRLELG